VWWREIVSIRDGVGSMVGNWFSDNLRFRVGNDASTLFLLDRCTDDAPLCVRFRRLYDLSENKSSTMAQMFDWGWGEGGEAWKWRRRLWTWEDKLVEECMNFLLTVVMQVDSVDVWLWVPDPVAGYLPSGAYRILTDRPVTHVVVPAAQLWRNDVHLKVLVFS